ncbi:MAG TPA: holo-ACP synthase [Firmicutes bacterium]|nr:holo-ACP synthase [Bacillota bacterium]
MIVGTGIDLVEIERVQRALAIWGERMLQRLFSDRELAIFPPGRELARRAAGRLAAKEAVLKALGTGLSGCSWRDVEVLRDERGRPVCHLSGQAARIAAQRGICRIEVSISHGREQAIAHALALGRQGGERECD